ncbi:unnamed protein product, partial [Iphiclides podalirius]
MGPQNWVWDNRVNSDSHNRLGAFGCGCSDIGSNAGLRRAAAGGAGSTGGRSSGGCARATYNGPRAARPSVPAENRDRQHAFATHPHYTAPLRPRHATVYTYNETGPAPIRASGVFRRLLRAGLPFARTPPSLCGDSPPTTLQRQSRRD